MTRPEWENEISLFELGSTLLERRWLVLGSALLGAIGALLFLTLAPTTYTSSATILSAQAGKGDPRLLGLAGQIGIDLGSAAGGSGSATSPALLVHLSTSRVILERILGDSVLVSDYGSVALVDLVLEGAQDVSEPSSKAERIRQERGLRGMRNWIDVREDRPTNAVLIEVRTIWPEVSFHFAMRLVEELNLFNLELGQASASEERRFVEKRLLEQEEAVRLAEGRLASFLEANRQFRNSPDLTFEFERLQRDLGLQQQVLAGLAQAREDVRIREVRDTPLLTVISRPVEAVERDPKSRSLAMVLGFLAGGVVGVLLALFWASVSKRKAEADEEVTRFFSLLRQTFRIRR